MSRPPVLGVRPPVVITANRPPLLTIVTPAEKPQTTVYVGKIASTVEDDFILSLLKFCGAVKSWKRAQDPSNGTPKGFGFCEFESAEGVLRALRLLTKFNVDGQELVLNVNQATRDYLESYVEKKKEELKKAKDTEKEDSKEEEGAANGENREGQENNELVNSTSEDPKKDDNETGDKDNGIASFGLVNDEDREADREASEKINEAINERLKTRPLPPPPPQKPDVVAVSNSEMPARSGDRDSDGDQKKDEKYDEEMSSEVKATSGDSPDRGRRHDSRNRERDRERDMKRDKERALEKIERDRERERARKERDREAEIQKAERQFKERVKEWESREKDKEYQRKYEKEREKEKERERRRLISDQEDESDDDSRRRRRRSDIEEKRKRRRREKDEDLEDRLREEAEIAEAEKKAAEELERQKEKEELQSSALVANGVGKPVSPENEMDVESSEVEDKGGNEQIFDSDSGQVNHIGEGVLASGFNDETVVLASGLDARAGGNAPAKKLGFGIVGSGKRAAVPSVFNAEDDEDAHKDKKMRPLVPIDYSTEELQAVQNDVPPNLAAAAEFAKRISHANNMKEEKTDVAKDRSRHSQDRSSTHRERDRRDDGTGSRSRNESREKSVDREHGDRSKGTENNKIIDAKQLIDMIPKTKDELFSYDVNWTVYDKHGLHDKMRPWISRKITEFLGEEEATLVDYIVSSMQEHVKASQMLELLQSILDEEAEMFVLKMWRMLIFEIKRVETGLVSSKSKA